jgi:hypothetical protein
LEQNLQIERDVLYRLLTNSFETYIAAFHDEYCQGILRIFIHDLDGFEENLDSFEFAQIWQRCGSLAGLKILLQKFHKFTQAMSAVDRVRFFSASLTPFESAASYTAKIDQCRAFPSLEYFYQNNGALVLHHVAEVLGVIKRSSHWAEWTRIGITAIQSGADLHAVRNTLHGSYTPFFQLVWSAITRSEPIAAVERLLEGLERWIHMLREAKIDLPAYFLRESEVCTSLVCDLTLSPVGWYRPIATLMGIDYDPLRQQCSLRICYEIFVSLSRLHHLPGSFTDQTEIPDTIWWEPDAGEHGEGRWLDCRSDADLKQIRLCSDVMNQDEFLLEQVDTYHGLADLTQDDNGILMRMIDSSNQNLRSRKRSSSQPAPLYRRRYDYETFRSSNVHKWLPPIHFCIARWTWVADDHHQSCDHNDGRSCVKGYGILKNLASGSCEGFLSVIRRCQRGYEFLWREDTVSHDGTPDCPQGCGKIDLRKISRPQLLPYWHPGSY